MVKKTNTTSPQVQRRNTFLDNSPKPVQRSKTFTGLVTIFLTGVSVVLISLGIQGYCTIT